MKLRVVSTSVAASAAMSMVPFGAFGAPNGMSTPTAEGESSIVSETYRHLAEEAVYSCIVTLSGLASIYSRLNALPQKYTPYRQRLCGEAPLSRHSLALACQFAALLPDTVPDAKVEADPDGEVFIRWKRKGGDACILTFDSDGRTIYCVRDIGGDDQVVSSESADDILDYMIPYFDA